jgi:hypothetical protein
LNTSLVLVKKHLKVTCYVPGMMAGIEGTKIFLLLNQKAKNRASQLSEPMTKPVVSGAMQSPHWKAEE